MHRLLLFLALLVGFTGCAVQSEPPLPALQAPDPADGTTRLRLPRAPVLGVFRPEASPVLAQVDRRDLAQYPLDEDSLVVIPAGKRELVFFQDFGLTEVTLPVFARRTAQATVDWDLPRDHVLVVRSAVEGMNVFFWLEDEATGRAVSRRFVGQKGLYQPKPTWKFVPLKRS